MAHIRKLTDKPRTLSWRAQIRRKGHKVQVKMFASKREAEHWAGEQERAIRMTGLPQTIDDLKKHFVSEIVIRYRDEITPTKGCRVSETTVLNKLLRLACTRRSTTDNLPWLWHKKEGPGFLPGLHHFG
jgi:hypothetical protein